MNACLIGAALIADPRVVWTLVCVATAGFVISVVILADRQLRRLPREILMVFMLATTIVTVEAQKVMRGWKGYGA